MSRSRNAGRRKGSVLVVVALAVSGLAGVALASWFVVAVGSGCAVIYCENGVDTLKVDNKSGSVVLVEEKRQEHEGALDTAVPGGGIAYMPLLPGQDGCSALALRAVNLQGDEVATLDRPCVDATWVIPQDVDQIPPRHVPPQLATDQVEVRLLVGITDLNNPVRWLRNLDTNTTNLKNALSQSGAGSVAGPYEEEFAMVFYLYGTDADRYQGHLVRD